MLHQKSIQRYGGAAEVRDQGGLIASVMAPQQTFCDELLYKAIEEFAAAYWHGIVTSHPFLDGNKRTGLAAASTFLQMNGYVLTATNAEAEEATLLIATGSMNREEVAAFVREHKAP